MNIQRTKTAAPVRLSLGYKVTWGLAALGTATISGTYGALLPIFFQDYLGLSSPWFRLASLIYAIWNAINDPLFGYVTDSTRSKHGRRIPFMRFTAPFLGLTFALVWLAPAGLGDQALFWWMLVSMLLYDTAYTIIGLVYSALLPEVSESDAERNGLQISASLFGLLGTLLGFLIPDFFRPKSGAEVSFLPMQISMAVMAVAAVLLILVTSFRVKERPEFTQVDKPLELLPALRYTFTSRAFLILVSANFMSILMQALLLGMIFYVADYVMKISTMTLLMALFIPLFIGVPVTTLIRARIGVVHTQQVLVAIAGVGLVAATFAPPQLIPFCIALAGFGLAGPQTLTNVLFAQVADEDEVRSGVRREGAFFGVNAMLTKPAQSAALILISSVLARTAFVTRSENAGQIFLNQPGSALFGIKMLFGLIPGIAMLLAAGILFFYPLKGAYLKQVQQQVLMLHAEKAARLEEQEKIIPAGKESWATAD